MSFRADLHCHTTCSDGSMTPKELVLHAKEVGLSGICITDHDSLAAYPEAIAACEEVGIWLGAGAEFSSVDEGKSVHVLGYDIDPEDGELKAFCKRHVERRRNRNRAIFEKLKQHQMPIDEEKLEQMLVRGHPVGRPHIALQMVEKGYVASVQEAFHLFLGDQKPCFERGAPITTDETLERIHQAGGKAFLAHPHFLKNSRLIGRLLSKPFDGIECYYSRLSKDQEEKWVRLAKNRNWLISGGSDFHGVIKPHIPLGCSWVDEATFDQIFEKHRWKF